MSCSQLEKKQFAITAMVTHHNKYPKMNRFWQNISAAKYIAPETRYFDAQMEEMKFFLKIILESS